MTGHTSAISVDQIAHRILLIRGVKVLIDADLAALYGVTTKRLNEQVKRNTARFPADFVFKLTNAEKLEVVANCDHLEKLKFSRINPFVFTEHGAIMVASVLNSVKAIEISVLIVRTFVKLRQTLVANAELRHKLFELENRLDSHDDAIKTLINAIRQLMEAPATDKKRPIGFVAAP